MNRSLKTISKLSSSRAHRLPGEQLARLRPGKQARPVVPGRELRERRQDTLLTLGSSTKALREAAHDCASCAATARRSNSAF